MNDEVGFRNGKTRWRAQYWRGDFFHTGSFTTIVAVKMGMVVKMLIGLALGMLAQGIFLLIGPVNGLVNQPTLLESTQGAVQGDPIRFAQAVLQVVL